MHADAQIDVLKVDAQGAEPQVVAGAGPLLAEGKVRAWASHCPTRGCRNQGQGRGPFVRA